MADRLFELILSVKRKCAATEEIVQKELGLSQAELHGILSIGADDRLPGSTFSAKMGLSVSRGSRVLQRLVVKKLARTHVNTEDRRSLTVSLTPRGAAMQEKARERMMACERRITAALSANQVSAIKQSLQLLERTL
jgi:DNA-binding MarR family transcriptional regulator